MTPGVSVDRVLRGLTQSYLAGRSSFQDFRDGYMGIFLAETPDRFRSHESWLLFSLISDQLTFVAEESAGYAARPTIEAEFRDWLQEAVKVLEGPGW
ncbi:MAG TPA: hypothetical protein VK939_13265 [Longimicrobiales bacterium]|nr:hypothetical protein [Longimicrobiales bacterium]